MAWRTSSELSALVHSLGVATRTEPNKSKWLTLLPGPALVNGIYCLSIITLITQKLLKLTSRFDTKLIQSRCK